MATHNATAKRLQWGRTPMGELWIAQVIPFTLAGQGPEGAMLVPTDTHVFTQEDEQNLLAFMTKPSLIVASRLPDGPEPRIAKDNGHKK